jgi:preprotein translocase subunit SecA
MASIWEEFVRVIFHVEVNIEPAQAQQMFEEDERRRAGDVQYSGAAGEERPSAIGEAQAQAGGVATAAASGTAASASAGNGPQVNPATVVKSDDEKIGRNDPCWCGSGKKYKKCHGA